jgi:cytochrome c oxidase subunit II
MVAMLLLLFFWALAIITCALFVGKVWWLPDLISVHGEAVDNQFVLTLAVAGVTFFLSQIMLGYFIWKFRARGKERALYWHENPKLEATWTIITLIIFVGLGIQGNRVWANYFLTEPPPDAIPIEVVAQQFAWNFRYPGDDRQFGPTDPELMDDALGNYIGLNFDDPTAQDDIMTQNLMAIPVNRPIRLILRTKDVTHSWFVPQLRVKQDTVPGLSIMVHFTATETGEYEIACTELCGLQHYMMRGRLLVMNDADYKAWLQERAGS